MTCDPSLARRPWREDLPFVLLPRPTDSSLVEPGSRRPETGHGRRAAWGCLLARIIHGRFCCNRGFAAATSLHAASAACRRGGPPPPRSNDFWGVGSPPLGPPRPPLHAAA